MIYIFYVVVQVKKASICVSTKNFKSTHFGKFNDITKQKGVSHSSD